MSLSRTSPLIPLLRKEGARTPTLYPEFDLTFPVLSGATPDRSGKSDKTSRAEINSAPTRIHVPKFDLTARHDYDSVR